MTDTTTVTYGFTATMTARPGRGAELVELLLTGLDEGNPAASEYCLVYLVSRSSENPDVASVIEGWTSEADHHRFFGGDAAQRMIAQFDGLLAEEPQYSALVPVGGKAVLR
ncbi:putative quinol monooxygenase [Microbacterium sp. GXF7504]